MVSVNVIPTLCTCRPSNGSCAVEIQGRKSSPSGSSPSVPSSPHGYFRTLWQDESQFIVQTIVTDLAETNNRLITLAWTAMQGESSFPGVTLSVAVMLSYFEAITLAPARCAQMLNTSREGRTRVSFVETRPISTYLFAFAAGKTGRDGINQIGSRQNSDQNENRSAERQECGDSSGRAPGFFLLVAREQAGVHGNEGSG